MQVDWYAGYEQFVKRNLTLLPEQQAASQHLQPLQQLVHPHHHSDIMTSMFDQQIKSEPMGFYSVASSRSDGSNSMVNLSDDREDLSQQEGHLQQQESHLQQESHHQQSEGHLQRQDGHLQNMQPHQQHHDHHDHHDHHEQPQGASDSPGRQSTGQQTVKEGTRSKPQPCKVCGKVLSSASSYYVHMKLHSGNKPYHCTVCEASFCRKPYLEVHMRTHTGERPFQCELCLKRFTQKSSLNTHKRVHTGERPYACDICQKRFAVKSYVTAHRWSHVAEKPLVCERCSLTFTSKSQFAIHIRTHTANTTFECNICGRTFVRDSYLIRHQNRVHREMNQANANHNPPTPQSSGGASGTGFESPVCELRYNEGQSSLESLSASKGGGIAAEIASLAKQNSLQLPLPLLHPQTTN
ncbi:zinc finger protein OZF-like isoform X1 [Leptopilina heterotoma]|uniref:zinc finger protein OZF-like isoform X1 n=2 Tax=Leptopilina heterotoma TaxID=63436 RepID=UPI001CA9810F|nr:zinc finger protein OZF-like isoform X1 [Leptopilina heterotoma]